MSRQILAIDIRNEAIAAVLITKGLKSNTVMGSAHLPIRAQSEDGVDVCQSGFSNPDFVIQMHSILQLR